MSREKPGAGRVFSSSGSGVCLLVARAVLGAVFLAMLSAPLWPAPGTVWGKDGQRQQARKGALHGQPWAFGASEDRKAAIWQRGVPAKILKQRAVSSAAKGAFGGVTAPRKDRAAAGAMNTGAGIDRALSTARSGAGTQDAARGARPKGGLGLSMENETTTWNVTPMRESVRPDEVLARDSRHVVRAFADMEPTDDLSISVGPELILKDEQRGAESAGGSQPDSALGLGMQFKLDF